MDEFKRFSYIVIKLSAQAVGCAKIIATTQLNYLLVTTLPAVNVHLLFHISSPSHYFQMKKTSFILPPLQPSEKADAPLREHRRMLRKVLLTLLKH